MLARALASVREHFFDHVTPDERPVLTRALQRITAPARCGPEPVPPT